MKQIWWGLLTTQLFCIAGLAQTPAESSTSTLTQEAAVKSAWWREIKVGYFTLSGTPIEPTNKLGGRFESYNYFTIDYRVTRDQKLSFRPAFSANFAGTDSRNNYRGTEWTVSDPFVNYTFYRWLDLGRDWKTDLQVRFYIPVSTSSLRQEQITRLKSVVGLSRDFRKSFGVAYSFEPDYFIQTRTGSLGDNGRPRGHKQGGLEQRLTGTWKWNRNFGLEQSVGTIQNWYYGVEAESLAPSRGDTLRIGTALDIYYNSLFAAIGVSQDRDYQRPRNSFALYRTDETRYQLLLSTGLF